MARTHKEIQKEIKELREIDRITTIKINQQFADLKQKQKEKAKLNSLFDSFIKAQLKTIKETEETKEFDERLKKFINKL
jgi:cell division protein FtsX